MRTSVSFPGKLGSRPAGAPGRKETSRFGRNKLFSARQLVASAESRLLRPFRCRTGISPLSPFILHPLPRSYSRIASRGVAVLVTDFLIGSPGGAPRRIRPEGGVAGSATATRPRRVRAGGPEPAAPPPRVPAPDRRASLAVPIGCPHVCRYLSVRSPPCNFSAPPYCPSRLTPTRLTAAAAADHATRLVRFQPRHASCSNRRIAIRPATPGAGLPVSRGHALTVRLRVTQPRLIARSTLRRAARPSPSRALTLDDGSKRAHKLCQYYFLRAPLLRCRRQPADSWVAFARFAYLAGRRSQKHRHRDFSTREGRES